MKFGGSSVESGHAIQRVVGIVTKRRERHPIVVVSAMGKTTNELLTIAKLAVEGNNGYVARLEDLRRYHWEQSMLVVGSECLEELASLLESCFTELSQLMHGLAILGELSPRSIDVVSSYGERMSSKVVQLAFLCAGQAAFHVDSREVIITDERHTQANPDFPESYRRLRRVVAKAAEDHIVVMGGFIASTREGHTSTLGRGGSDYTAAIVGAGVGAEEIQIWTDVDGMMTTDPRLIANAIHIDEISFAEAAELAFFGAKVLHPATVRPALDKNIPVVILNSRNPEAIGTRIVKETRLPGPIVKALACKRHITLVNIHSARMFMAHGFLKRVFEVFDRHETSVDVVTTSEVNVSMTLDNSRHLVKVKAELEEFAEVSTEKNLAIVSVIGHGIGETAGVAARTFRALENINVRMISQGSSLLNLSVVIAEKDLEPAMRALHQEWFE